MLKLFGRVSLLAVIFLLGAHGARSRAEASPATSAVSDSEFAKGATTYTTAAAEQLANIRQAMDATKAGTAEEDRDLYDAVYRALADCDGFLAKLKRSGKSTFDANKKAFETALQHLIKEIERTKGE